MEAVKKIQISKIFKVSSLILIGTLLLTLSAKIKVPFYPVPMTMQTFAVILIGMAYGWKLGVITVFAYLVEGAIGLPVFAGTPERGIGASYMIGPTGGYLFGFLIAAFISGFLNFKKNFFVRFLLISLSITSIYIFGVPWLTFLKGWEFAYVWGIEKFMLAELFKIALLTLLYSNIIKFKKFI